MLRPRVEIGEEMLERARRGALDNENTSLDESLFNITSVWAPQIVNCCRRGAAYAMDISWKVLCLNHVLTFDGFLDAIANANSHNFFDKEGEIITRVSPFKRGDEFSAKALQNAIGCTDIHWSPLTHWRLDDPEIYRTLNFVGHLENANRDAKLLLDRLDLTNAWDEYGASGWGEFRNESIFSSSSTVKHAQHANRHLSEFYTSDVIEKRVERFYEADYNNKYLNLTRVQISSEAES